MNYKNIYNRLVERGKFRTIVGYAENHHIIPKCMGGGDTAENLVKLTPEEHFLAHVLLVKIYPEEKNLILAVQKMTATSGSHGGKRKRKMYGWLRRLHAKRMSVLAKGENNSQFGTIWINDGVRSSKIHSHKTIPEGWSYGRVKKLKPIKPKPLHGPTKGYRYLGKSKATDEQVIAALINNDMDIDKAMAYLGYKPNTFGNSRNRFKTILASVV